MRYAVVTYWHDLTTICEELRSFDKVFACELAAKKLLESGIIIETIISDFDTTSMADITRINNNTKIIKLSKAKDETDARALLTHVVSQYPAATIVLYNAFDTRVDYALSLLSLFELSTHLIIKTPNTVIQELLPGVHLIAKNNNFPYISFIAIESVTNLTLNGFLYPLVNHKISPFSDLTVSNELLTEEGEVSFSGGRLLVIYSRD